MAFELNNALAEVRYRLADSRSTSHPLLDDESLTAAVRASLQLISRDLTPQFITEIAGSGVNFFGVAASLPYWKEGFSGIRSVVYPAVAFSGVANRPPALDPDTDWTLEEAVVASVRTVFLFLPNATPQTGETVRVLYTGVHTLAGLDDVTATSIQSAFESAFYDLCASRAFTMVAADMARRDQPTIAADNVNFQNVVKNLKMLADDYLCRYKDAVGAGSADGGPPGTDQLLNWQTGMNWGVSWLFHGRQFPIRRY